MTDDEKAAEQALTHLGAGGALLAAMRIVILVGQRDPENPEVIAAAQEAIAAMKRLGDRLGALPKSN
jgi:hypothetical protein